MEWPHDTACRIAVAPLATALVLLWAGSAHGFQPAPGGRYVGHAKARPGATLSVKLTLANDGREFAAPSFVDMGVFCGDSYWAETLTLHSDDRFQFTSVPIRRSGRFGYRGSYGRMRGRFARSGRVAVGTAVMPRAGRCGRVTWRFRARLTGQPNRAVPGKPSRCDRVTVAYFDRLAADDAYEVLEQGLGCTRARALARRWHRSRECSSLQEGATCALGPTLCQRIAGGLLEGSAIARCQPAARPEAMAEFVRERPCPPPAGWEFSLWAINVDCGVASGFQFDQLLAGENLDEGACGEFWNSDGAVTCAPVAGFTCAIREVRYSITSGFRARCVDDQVHFRAFRFEDYG